MAYESECDEILKTLANAHDKSVLYIKPDLISRLATSVDVDTVHGALSILIADGYVISGYPIFSSVRLFAS